MNIEPKEAPNFEGEEMKLPTMRPQSRDRNSSPLFTSSTLITLLFLALGLILAGLTYWYIMGSGAVAPAAPLPLRPTLETNREPETVTATAQVESFTIMSTSDEIAAIEADLESTNLESLEGELLQIDQELEASFE